MDKIHAYFSHVPVIAVMAAVLAALFYNALFKSTVVDEQRFLFLCEKEIEFQKKTSTADPAHVEMLNQISALRHQAFHQLKERRDDE